MEGGGVRAEAGGAGPLQVVTLGPDLFYATCSNLIFAIENTEPSIAYIVALRTLVQRMNRELGRGVGLMVVIRADTKPPSEEVREHIKATAKSFGSDVLAFAHVVEGEGFLAAAKRAAFTLLMGSVRLGFPIKVFRNVSEGMPWLVRTVGNAFEHNLSMAELVRLVEDFRRNQLDKPRPPAA
jgi:hypothetical protein